MKNDITKKFLRSLQDVDIRTVKAEDLVDMETVTIRKDLPPEERVKDYIHQIRNPYCYVSHGTIVKLSFTGTRTIEECLETCLSLETISELPENGGRAGAESPS